jgi:hypothetical protein
MTRIRSLHTHSDQPDIPQNSPARPRSTFNPVLESRSSSSNRVNDPFSRFIPLNQLGIRSSYTSWILSGTKAMTLDVSAAVVELYESTRERR